MFLDIVWYLLPKTAPTNIPSGGAHDWLRLKLLVYLSSCGEVEYPVVVDEGNQGPGLPMKHFNKIQEK